VVKPLAGEFSVGTGSRFGIGNAVARQNESLTRGLLTALAVAPGDHRSQSADSGTHESGRLPGQSLAPETLLGVSQEIAAFFLSVFHPCASVANSFFWARMHTDETRIRRLPGSGILPFH